MKKLTHTAIINGGIQGLLCAALASIITGMFSWSFVTSTNSYDWMGSGALGDAKIAMIYSTAVPVGA